ncbi:type II toxin-antitoxin system Phd/YefM family antitoxin [Pseudanabaena sp. UWO311]|jgi:prevent-host-death family protein|uniref:type II toxin-antitoxin system Phd/YefM family antitoxin n=1 Tax=Pseudanabaena sp. UWO311 TaxID=2487337 RepID=UPI00115B0DAC|nr:DUF2281 domain-containing protein [Pseudanabaena sp. UWO311]TYQ28690.1 type II toxin-antitoxin system Phd/YefM family antitoxin [Pseudanabaena sp. UWO311]
MHQVTLQDAEKHLANLLAEANRGEEVIVVNDDGTLFKIIAIGKTRPVPKFGSAKGLIKMSDDFDEPLEDFAEYAP